MQAVHEKLPVIFMLKVDSTLYLIANLPLPTKKTQTVIILARNYYRFEHMTNFFGYAHLVASE